MKKTTHTFTLLELLVAMAVFSVMMTVLMQFFSSAQKVTSASEKRTTVFSDARVAMELMARDIKSAIHHPKQPLLTGDDIGITSTFDSPHTASGGNGITFMGFTQNTFDNGTTAINPGVLCQISYFLNQSSEANYESTLPDNALVIALKEGAYGSIPEGTAQKALIIGGPDNPVTDLHFEAIDARYPYNPGFRVETLTDNHKLPYAVTISMTVGEAPNNRLFNKMVYIGGRGQ